MKAQINGPAVLVTPRTRHNLLGDYAMPTIASPRFYVYILCRPARGKQAHGKPFYVGKGAGKRIYNHDREARNGCSCHKCNVIRKIWRAGGEVQRYIVFTTDDEHEAFAYERETIALYGRENLANLTDGGEGILRPDQESRVKLRNRAKAQWSDPTMRAKMVAANRAVFAKPGAREQRSATNRARYADPEARAKTAAAVKASWAKDPERRERLKARNKARTTEKNTDE